MPRDKCDQLDQIQHPEGRPAGGHRDERILRCQARPAGRQRRQMPMSVTKVHSMFAEAAPVGDKVDLVSDERMERVSDTDNGGQIRCAGGSR